MVSIRVVCDIIALALIFIFFLMCLLAKNIDKNDPEMQSSEHSTLEDIVVVAAIDVNANEIKSLQ